MAPAQRPLLPVLLLLLLPPPPPPPPLALAEDASRANSDRYAVYWNRSNPSKCQTHEEPQTNPGEPGQKEVVGAALCPTCHRSVLLAGSWQGKETPSAGSAVARPPPVADLTALSEEPPKGMALLVWLQVPRGRGGRPRGLHCGAATPPNAVDRPCLRLKVYVRPTNETLYEAPEPIFTSNNSCSSLGSCQIFLSTVPVLWTLLGS
ncbi:ephrin-A2 isoform X4 [Molossus molossus]|uniref:ephrin-A2 isoform X4 n=1 Tax=Molossus molossus TaxID=27622 RepID=UPI0017475937|nr:ephrin-A2 isoform X4 [Molossus molossus]